MHSIRNADTPRLLCAEVLADWLSWNLSRDELAAEAKRLFRRLGPALPRRMRNDLDHFIENRSVKALAECLAMNEDAARRDDFVAWCRELAAEGNDAHRVCGVRQEDFCAERGPGHTA